MSLREPMFNRPGRPRVIRRAQGKPDKAGRFKWAVDRRLDARVERVKARATRPCAAGQSCLFFERAIRGGDDYVKVHANEGQGKFIKGRMIYSPRDYHFGCVPEQYRPMLRFIK